MSPGCGRVNISKIKIYVILRVSMAQDYLLNLFIKITLEYRIIGSFGIIGRKGGWKLLQKLKIGGAGIMERGKKMTQKLFWCQYSKGRTKCCHILKAHKFSLMIYNYMDISSSLMLNFFLSLCVF